MAVDPALIGIVGALAGAIVGLVGSVAVQRAANVHARELWARQQRTNMLTNQRADLLKAIYEFVLAAERAQGMAGPDRSRGEQSEASAVMWATCRLVRAMATEQLRDAASEYANELHRAIWSPNGAPAWERAHPANVAFSKAVDAELAVLDAEITSVSSFPPG